MNLVVAALAFAALVVALVAIGVADARDRVAAMLAEQQQLPGDSSTGKEDRHAS